MHSLSRRLIVLAGLAFVAFAAGVFYRGSSPLDAPPRLVIGGPSDLAMLVVLANERGLFKQAGIDVDYRPLQTGKIAQDALMSGDLDVGIIVDPNIAFIGFQKETSVKVFASIQEQNGDSIVARRDRGIATVAELKGKTIGYTPGTTSHVFLDRLLRTHGISWSDIKPLAMPPPSLEAAVVRGDIDAASIWQPFRFNAMKQLGAKGLALSDAKAYTAYALVATRVNILDKKRVALTRFLTSLLTAESLLESNSDSAIGALAPKLGITEEALRDLWPQYRMRVSLEEAVKNNVISEGEWIRASQEGFIGKPLPNYASFFDASLLRQLKPERVSLTQ